MNNEFISLLNSLKSLPNELLQSTCLIKLPDSQIQEINQTIPIQKSQLVIYSVQQQCLQTLMVLIIPNLLVIGDQYLVLSNCRIIKLNQYFKQDKQTFAIQLTNGNGNLLLFFNGKILYKEWLNKLKLFCKLSNFSNKFILLEQIIKDFYAIQHKKTKKTFTAYVHSFRASSPIDILNSEIQTLRSIKFQSLLELKWVYEDNHYLYLIFDYFRCEKLIDLLNQGLVLDQTQMASMILQLLQTVKFLKKNKIYHGNITPNNVLINTQSSFLQLFLVNMTFISTIEKDPIDQYIKNVHESYIAPEILQNGSKPSSDTDLYQVGVVLYYLTFFLHNKRRSEKVDQIRFELIDQAEQSLQQLDKQKQQKYKMVYCTSQLDLLRRLLDKKDNRIKIEEAIKHHWFINIKQKLKPQIVRRKQHLPSLKTIIELCEQNEYSKKFEKYQNHLDEELVLEENNLIQQLMTDLEKHQQFKRPSKENHEKLKMFEQFKTQVDYEKQPMNDKQLVLSKSMM